MKKIIASTLLALTTLACLTSHAQSFLEEKHPTNARVIREIENGPSQRKILLMSLPSERESRLKESKGEMVLSSRSNPSDRFSDKKEMTLESRRSHEDSSKMSSSGGWLPEQAELTSKTVAGIINEYVKAAGSECQAAALTEFLKGTNFSISEDIVLNMKHLSKDALICLIPN